MSNGTIPLTFTETGKVIPLKTAALTEGARDERERRKAVGLLGFFRQETS